MDYKFALQASAPRSIVIKNDDDRSLADAIETVFPLEAEFAILVWNWIYVPLSYKYDISLMMDDIVRLLELMMSTNEGSQTIAWPSNTFACVWNVQWMGTETTIKATWSCVLGDTESMLNAKPMVCVATSEFVAEWKRLLEVSINALQAAGYTMQQLPGMRQLTAVAASVPRYGRFYCE